MSGSKILFVSNLDWAIFNFHLPIARALREQGNEVVLVAPRGDYATQMEAQGFRFVDWRLNRRSMNPIGEALSIQSLARIYRREKPRAVQHFFIKPNIYGSIASRIIHVPIIINTWEGLGVTFTSSLRGRALRTLIVPFARAVFRTRKLWTIHVNAENVRTFEILKMTDPARVSLIPTVGVNTDRFKADGKRQTGTPVVLMASRLLLDKGVREYVEAARLLRDRGIQAQFWLCGATDEGNPMSVSNKMLEQWRRDGVVKILGRRDDMPDVLRQVNIVVLPSYHEGLPRILLEAAATGLPLVATDIPGCRAIVRNSINGLLVPPREIIPLADALQQLLEDASLRARFGAASRLIAENEYSEAIMIEKYLEVYRLVGVLK